MQTAVEARHEPTARDAVHLRLLPSFELTQKGAAVELPLAAQRLLALVALRERAVLRSYVAGVLWPDTTENKASGSLRSALWRAQCLSEAIVNASPTHLRLAPWVSVDLREAHAYARLLLDSGSAAAPALASGLLSSDLLCDWYEDWVLLERERFRQLRLHALEVLCERLTAVGRFADGVEAGLAAVAAEPLRESSQRALIKAHFAEGNAAEALRQYHSYRNLLARELEIAPSSALDELIASMLDEAATGFKGVTPR